MQLDFGAVRYLALLEFYRSAVLHVAMQHARVGAPTVVQVRVEFRQTYNVSLQCT